MCGGRGWGVDVEGRWRGEGLTSAVTVKMQFTFVIPPCGGAGGGIHTVFASRECGGG